jgi:hypothetical protein
MAQEFGVSAQVIAIPVTPTSPTEGCHNFGDKRDRLNRARQQNLKACALAQRTDDVDYSEVTTHDSLKSGEPQTATSGFGREERIKTPGLYLLRHTAARVGDFQL